MTTGAGWGADVAAGAEVPLRILMVAARYFPLVGGTETHIHEAGRRLVAKGHDVSVLTSDPTGRLPPYEETAGLKIKRVRAFPARTDWHFAPGVFAEVAQTKCDVVHVQGYHTFVAPIAMMAAIRHAKPFVLSFHSGGHSSGLRQSMREAQCALLRPLVKRAAKCIAVSQFEAARFTKALRLPPSRFAVVPNGAEIVAPAAPISGPPCLIVSVGRLERYKGHQRAIAAMPHVLKSRPEAQLRIVGSGPFEKDLRQQIKNLRLEDCVTIGGIAPGDRLAMGSLLTSASLVVLLSDYEAHPVAVLEALSLKRPVLVAATSGLNEIADKGLARAVLLGAPPTDVAAAILEELTFKREAASIPIPTWDQCCDNLLGIYAGAVSDGRCERAKAL